MLNDVATRFETVFARFDEQVEQQTSAFANVASTARAAAGELTAAARQMGEAGKPVAEAASSIESTSKELRQVAVDQQASLATISQLGGRLAESSQAVQASWQRYAERFDQVDQTLAHIFEQFMHDADAYHQVVRNFMVELDQSLEKSVRTLGGGVKELNDGIEDLADTLQSHHQQQTAAE